MRPTHPTLAEVRTIGQKGLNEPYAMGRLYGSRLSRYLTWALARTPLAPNGVTALGVGLGVLSGALLWAPLAPIHLLSVLGYQLSYLLDFSDGELARIRGIGSNAGSYLDWLGHFYVPVIGAGMLGVQLVRETGEPLWFVPAIAAMLGLSAFHFSCKEHIVIAYLRRYPERTSTPAVQNAMQDRPLASVARTGTAIGSARPGILQVMGAALIYPGGMHLLSLSLIADLVAGALLGHVIIFRLGLLLVWTVGLLGHAVLAIRRNRAALLAVDEAARRS